MRGPLGTVTAAAHYCNLAPHRATQHHTMPASELHGICIYLLIHGPFPLQGYLYLQAGRGVRRTGFNGCGGGGGDGFSSNAIGDYAGFRWHETRQLFPVPDC